MIARINSEEKYELKSLNLDSLFKGNFDGLSRLGLNKYSELLTDLSLVNCGLNDEKAYDLLLNKFCLKKLKRLNLKENSLTFEFIKKIVGRKTFDFFGELQHLNLSGNEFSLTNSDAFKELIDNLPKIRKIELKNTDAEEKICEFLKEKLIGFYTDNFEGNEDEDRDTSESLNISNSGEKVFSNLSSQDNVGVDSINMLDTKNSVDKTDLSAVNTKEENHIKKFFDNCSDIFDEDKNFYVVINNKLDRNYYDKLYRYFPYLFDHLQLDNSLA